MDGFLTEQATAERFAGELEGSFTWAGAVGRWWLQTGGQWTAEQSIALLWTSVIGLLRQMVREDQTMDKGLRRHLRMLETEKGQRAILKLLESHPALQSSPDDFEKDDGTLNLTGGWIELESGKVSPPDRSRWYLRRARCRNLDWLTSPFVEEEVARKVSGDAPQVLAFVNAALRRERGGARILHQNSRMEQDLLPLYGLLEGFLGDYVMRLSYKDWSRWPECLTSKVASRFMGVRLFFLDPAPSGRFPAPLLDRIVRAEREEYLGADGVTYSLLMPSHFVLLGPLSLAEPWQRELLSLMLLVSGPRGFQR